MRTVRAPGGGEPLVAETERSVVPLFLRVVVWTAALVALASWAFLAVVHVDDGYLVNHVSGVWMALAMSVNEGVLYPPLFDGENFGGTRHMPLQFVVHAGLAHVVGGYLEAGKALAYIIAVGLAASLWIVLRRQIRVPAWLAVGLIAAVLVTQVGQLGTLSIRGHALPVLLQVVALAVVAGRQTRRAAVVAGLLCALALLAKLTAVWGVLACVVWLTWSRRGRVAAVLAGTYGAGALLGLVSVELLSGGRFTDNLLGLSASAFEESPAALVAGAVRKLVALSTTAADATWLLAPLAVTGLVVALRRREPSIHHVALVAATLVTTVVMADIGAGDSHLLDVHVLLALVVGGVWRDHVTEASFERATFVAPLVAVSVAAGLAGTYATQLAEKTREAARVSLGREPNRFALDGLRRVVPPGSSILSEDATVPVVLGRLPTVLDPFMLVRISRSHPDWVATLERRIERREFDRVVLFHRPGFPLDGEDRFWRDLHFGPGVIEAIAANYRPAHVTSGYSVYVPRSG